MSEIFRLPQIPAITPLHVQESERFKNAFQTIKDGLTERLKPDEELALFYVVGAESIRVHHIQIANDTLLLLYGEDSLGNKSCGVVHVREVNLIFKRLRLGDKKQRTPIGFSVGDKPTEMDQNGR